MLAVLVVVFISYLTVLAINWNKKTKEIGSEISFPEAHSTQEFEVIPTEIDTFNYAEINDQISVSEISTNQHLITELSGPDHDTIKPIQHVLIVYK